MQSQWVGTHTFAFKAEVDFDGTFLAAKLQLNTRQVPIAPAANVLGQIVRLARTGKIISMRNYCRSTLLFWLLPAQTLN